MYYSSGMIWVKSYPILMAPKYWNIESMATPNQIKFSN